eukprot:2833029-Lingulodinium_polyedra.AAC.1
MKNTPGIAISNPARCRARSRKASNRVSSSSVLSPTQRWKIRKSNVLRRAVSSARGSNRRANRATRSGT